MKNKKIVIIMLIILLVLCVLLMEYTMYSQDAYNQKGGIVDPVFGIKIAWFDIVGGAICYSLGKLVDERKKKVCFVLKFLGLWNLFGGIIIEIISIIRYL